MSVELDPVELAFKRPFNQEVSQVLRLRNPHSDPVAFKVKTTAPKQYCVRPNSGRIEAGGEVEVNVLLQAMREDPAPDAKCRDKFLVQSVTIPAGGEFNNWSHIEQVAKSSIQEKKIRVQWLAADGAHATPAKSTFHTTKDEAASSHRSPSPPAYTPSASHANHAAVDSSSGAVKREDRPSDSKDLGEIKRSATNPASDKGAIASAVASAGIPTTADELKAALAKANAEIVNLKDQVTPQGLRQRKTGSGDSDSKSSGPAQSLGLQNVPTGGVPVQVVAGLCLLSFLLAYFFF